MKKLSTLLTVSTLAVFGVLLTGADCAGSDSNIETCEADTDCTTEGDICLDGACTPASCNDDVDCDLSVDGDAFSKDELDAGNTECEDEAFVTIFAFDGETEICITGEDPDPTVSCGDGFAAVDADGPDGTVSVCVSGGGTCTDGQCT
ncbi:MAG: hypothetical protein Q8O67_09255 [Deltaproteobacteria bacterium]|nr:hypothetical protein [Deltaproteobacteria bacterium]